MAIILLLYGCSLSVCWILGVCGERIGREVGAEDLGVAGERIGDLKVAGERIGDLKVTGDNNRKTNVVRLNRDDLINHST